jgi:hypothetical protein
MGGCTRSSQVIPDDACRADQPAAAGSPWHGAAGRPFMADRTPPARSPQRPRLTSRPATCQLGLRTGERLHPDDIMVPRAGGKNLTPGAFARNPRPLDPDALHFCHLLGRSLRGRADGSLLVFRTGSSGTVRARARDRRHPKVPKVVESLATASRTKVPASPSPARSRPAPGRAGDVPDLRMN